MGEILLVSVGSPEIRVLDFLTYTLPEHFDMPCRITSGDISLDAFLNPNRGQHYSTEILAALLERPAPVGSKLLGITDADLYIPILTFVFGEAQLDGEVAVLSTFRLRQEFYGLPPDESVHLDRVEKEAVHELGHTFGLVHCSMQECVMHFSNSVEEVDLKSNGFCNTCSRLVLGKTRKG